MVEEKKVTDTRNFIPRFVACQFEEIKKFPDVFQDGVIA